MESNLNDKEAKQKEVGQPDSGASEQKNKGSKKTMSYFIPFLGGAILGAGLMSVFVFQQNEGMTLGGVSEQVGKNYIEQKDISHSFVAKSPEEYKKELNSFTKDGRLEVVIGDRKTKEWVYGNPDGRFLIIEFSDPECPFCKRAHRQIQKVVDGTKGKAGLVWKWEPLPFHGRNAVMEALFIECAGLKYGNKRFWSALNYHYDTGEMNGRGFKNPEEALKHLGFKTPQEAQNVCSTKVNGEEPLKNVNKTHKQAFKLGVNGTPVFFIIDRETGLVKKVVGATPEKVEKAIHDFEVLGKDAGHDMTVSEFNKALERDLPEPATPEKEPVLEESRDK